MQANEAKHKGAPLLLGGPSTSPEGGKDRALFAVAPMGLGLLPILINKRNQGLHDKIAGTLVIDDDEASKTLAQLIQESK